MHRAAQFALRFILVVAIVSLVSTVATSRGSARDPYTSALSNLAVSQVLAAQTCNDKACVGGSRFNISCGRLIGFNCQKFGPNLCSDGMCP